MNEEPLPRRIGVGVELSLVALCLIVAVAWGGRVFVGGISGGTPAKHVTLISSGTSESLFTHARTVGDFLHEVGIDFAPEDRIEPPPQTPLKTGLVVSYLKAVQVLVSDAGRPAVEMTVPCETVCDLLDDAGIEIGPMDRVVPHLSTPLEPDMVVDITRVEVLDLTSRHDIEPPLVVEADPDLLRGHVEEVQPGAPGVAEDITRIYYRNGEETLRLSMGSRTIEEPRQRVVKVGTRSVPMLASRGGSFGRDVISMVATAYDPGPISCAPYADGRTATGHIAGRGVCAVDPAFIPLGTQLWVEGYGYALACDTGGAIKGNRIDLCFNTYSEAIAFGRRTVVVYILD